MNESAKGAEEEAKSGGALQSLAASATEQLLESVSSLAGSAVEEGASRVNDFSINALRSHLDRMVKERSVVGAGEIVSIADGVTMSPMIRAMLEACFLSLGGGGRGKTWVVCAPTDQGKTVASQFLIHGNHTMRPTRSLKVDATNMTNFAKDFAAKVNCTAAETELSTLLCDALSDTAPGVDDPEAKVARASAAAINVAGKYLCVPGNVAVGSLMEMRDATEHKVLGLDTGEDEPAPILIIDEFYCDTQENQDFVRTLLRDAAAKGVVVFLITNDQAWASKLINLNGGTKCAPLRYNVDNVGYDGSTRFTEVPRWNDFYWPVEDLRKLVGPMCTKYGIDPEKAVLDGAQLTPAEANRIVLNMRMNKQLL